MQHDEPTPRKLPERTGKHFCVRCRVEVAADEYFRNDYVCDACAEAIVKEQREPDRRRP